MHAQLNHLEHVCASPGPAAEESAPSPRHTASPAARRPACASPCLTHADLAARHTSSPLSPARLGVPSGSGPIAAFPAGAAGLGLAAPASPCGPSPDPFQQLFADIGIDGLVQHSRAFSAIMEPGSIGKLGRADGASGKRVDAQVAETHAIIAGIQEQSGSGCLGGVAVLGLD